MKRVKAATSPPRDLTWRIADLLPEIMQHIGGVNNARLPIEYAFAMPTNIIGTREHATWRLRNVDNVYWHMEGRTNKAFHQASRDAHAEDKYLANEKSWVVPSYFPSSLADVIDAYFLRDNKMELFALFRPLLVHLTATATATAPNEAYLAPFGVVNADLSSPPKGDDALFVELLITAIGSNMCRLAYAAGLMAAEAGSNDFMPLLDRVAMLYGSRHGIETLAFYDKDNADVAAYHDDDIDDTRDARQLDIQPRFTEYFGFYMLGVYDGKHADKMAYVHATVASFVATAGGDNDDDDNGNDRQVQTLLDIFHYLIPRLIDRDDAAFYREHVARYVPDESVIDAALRYEEVLRLRTTVSLGPEMSDELRLRAFIGPRAMALPRDDSDDESNTEDIDEFAASCLVSERNIGYLEPLLHAPATFMAYVVKNKHWRGRRMNPPFAAAFMRLLNTVPLTDSEYERAASCLAYWAYETYKPTLAGLFRDFLTAKVLRYQPFQGELFVVNAPLAETLKVSFHAAILRWTMLHRRIGHDDGRIEIVLSAREWKAYFLLDDMDVVLRDEPLYPLQLARKVAIGPKYDASFELLCAKADPFRHLDIEKLRWEAHKHRGPRFVYKFLLDVNGELFMQDLGASHRLPRPMGLVAYKNTVQAFLTVDIVQRIFALSLDDNSPITLFRALRLCSYLLATRYARRHVMGLFDVASALTALVAPMADLYLKKACTGHRFMYELLSEQVDIFAGLQTALLATPVPTAQDIMGEDDEIIAYFTYRYRPFDVDY